MNRRSFLKVATTAAATAAFSPNVQAAEPSRKITISLNYVEIRDYHERIFGGGVDIYPAYFLNNAKGPSSGFGRKRNNLKNGIKRFDSDIFSMRVGYSKAAIFNLFMMEADGNNDAIKKVLRRLREDSKKLDIEGKFDDPGDSGKMFDGLMAATVGTGWAAGGIVASVNTSAASASIAASASPLGAIAAVWGVYYFSRHVPGREDDLFGVWKGAAVCNRDGSSVKIGIVPAEKNSRSAKTPILLESRGKQVQFPKATFKNGKQDLDFVFSARFE